MDSEVLLAGFPLGGAPDARNHCHGDTVACRMDDQRKAQEPTRRAEGSAASSDGTTDGRIDARRTDKDFQARLSKLIEDNQRILDRLAG
jgi:hypothetical protein